MLKELSLSQKILLIMLYGLLFLMVVFSVLAESVISVKKECRNVWINWLKKGKINPPQNVLKIYITAV